MNNTPKEEKKQENFIEFIFSLENISINTKNKICDRYIQSKETDLNDWKKTIGGTV